jgi:hypothetical protein
MRSPRSPWLANPAWNCALPPCQNWPAVHEPIVSQVTFQRCADAIAARRTGTSGSRQRRMWSTLQGSDLEFRLRPDSNLVQRGRARALLRTTTELPPRGKDIDHLRFPIHREQNAPAANAGFSNSGPLGEGRGQARIERVNSKLPEPSAADQGDQESSRLREQR